MGTMSPNTGAFLCLKPRNPTVFVVSGYKIAAPL